MTSSWKSAATQRAETWYPSLKIPNNQQKKLQTLSPLYIAVMKENMEIISLLLQAGVNPFEKCAKGSCAIRKAVVYENFEIMKELLPKRVLTEEEAKTLFECLVCSVGRKNKKVVEYLCLLGADPFRKYCGAFSALDYAIIYNNFEILDALIPKRCLQKDEKKALNEGLFFAVANSKLKVAERLCSLGADPFERSGQGLSAIARAKQSRNTEMLTILTTKSAS